MEDEVIYNAEPQSEAVQENIEVKPEAVFVEDFTFENTKYVAQKDFENTFTIRQAEEAAPLMSEVIKALKPYMAEDENGVLQIDMSDKMAILDTMISTKVNAQILALIFWNENDTKFNVNNYRKRIDIFRDLPLVKIKELRENTANFFSFILSESGTSVLTSIR